MLRSNGRDSMYQNTYKLPADTFRTVLQSRSTFVCIGAELVSGPQLRLSATRMASVFGVSQPKAPPPSVLQLEDPSWWNCLRHHDYCCCTAVKSGKVLRPGRFPGPHYSQELRPCGCAFGNSRCSTDQDMQKERSTRCGRELLVVRRQRERPLALISFGKVGASAR